MCVRRRQRRLGVSPLDFWRAGAVVGSPRHDEQQIGQPVDVDQQLRLERIAAEATIARSARRQIVRATCSAAPAGDPPARMNRRSGGSSASRLIDPALEPRDVVGADRRLGDAFGDPAAGSASRAPSAKRSRWIARSSRQRPRRAPTRAPGRARRPARRRPRTRRRGGPLSTRACRRRGRSRRYRRSWCRFSRLDYRCFTTARAGAGSGAASGSRASQR